MAKLFDIDNLREGIRTSEPPHSTTCIVRSITDTHVEAQFDPDAVGAWVALPIGEIKAASVIRQIKLLTGEYSLVKLELEDEHPQVEIAALTAQVNQLLNGNHETCCCGGAAQARPQVQPALASLASTRYQTEPADPGDPGPRDCHRLCKGLRGCEYWGCMFGCIAAG